MTAGIAARGHKAIRHLQAERLDKGYGPVGRLVAGAGHNRDISVRQEILVGIVGFGFGIDEVAGKEIALTTISTGAPLILLGPIAASLPAHPHSTGGKQGEIDIQAHSVGNPAATPAHQPPHLVAARQKSRRGACDKSEKPTAGIPTTQPSSTAPIVPE